MSKAITSTKRVRNFIAVSDEVLDALELLGTYYLKNPDESKLKELKRMIENRFEESNEFSDSYLAVVNFIEENFETVEIETKVINW